MKNDNSHEDENPVIKGLQEMLSNLEEGGPDVVMEDVIAYVHQFLPPEIDDRVGKNIVRYRAWNKAYREAVRERVAVDRMVAGQDWITVWNRNHKRHSLPLPTQEETVCIALLAGKSKSVPLRNLFQDLGQRAQITNLVHLQQIAEGAVQHGFLSAEEHELELSEETEEFTLRGGPDSEPQTERTFQLAQSSEELLASVCQQLLENRTLTEEVKQSLLKLADALLLAQPLKNSFADWLREL
ncbi:hypothetical protein [Gimesia fumaroli]|uniref:Uncharacterized protein n=1 Tax=Gimesia fumaroli TaxID=2527976 RepID=A0A518I5V9_9PLAN|nr:hypothetical protein [Gimesia fumaroli]QDV48496.1 hypothetical protein Enr17x_05080 [Gimesia fumaroli]